MLRVRPADETCAVAIVLSKIDVLFDQPEQARREMSEADILTALQPLVTVARASDKVLQAACFPVSALGFSVAVPLPGSGAQAEGGTAGLDEGEQEWVLPPGAAPEPWNTLPLLVYSVASGLLSVEVESSRSAEMKALYRELTTDLEALDAWMVPIKGQF